MSMAETIEKRVGDLQPGDVIHKRLGPVTFAGQHFPDVVQTFEVTGSPIQHPLYRDWSLTVIHWRSPLRVGPNHYTNLLFRSLSDTVDVVV